MPQIEFSQEKNLILGELTRKKSEAHPDWERPVVTCCVYFGQLYFRGAGGLQPGGVVLVSNPPVKIKKNKQG